MTADRVRRFAALKDGELVALRVSLEHYRTRDDTKQSVHDRERRERLLAEIKAELARRVKEERDEEGA